MKTLKLIHSFLLILSLYKSVVGQSVQSDSFLSKDAELHYVEAGSGTPVILIHGFTDNTALCYQHELDSSGTNFIDKLAKSYQVIGMDVRGHGQSEKPTEVSKYGKELVEDVIRLMDHLSIEKAHVIGYSMGAFITGNLVANYPERLLSATFIGGTPLTQSQFSPEHQLNELLGDISENLKRGGGIIPLLQWFWPNSQPEPSSEELEAINQQVMAGQNSQALQACIATLNDLFHVDAEKLVQSDIPITLINGTEDPLKEYINPFQQTKRNTSVLIEGANHMDILMYPSCLTAVEKSLELANLQLSSNH
jgi:pimeloyl-ACP methyl ester carboxylesterase